MVACDQAAHPPPQLLLLLSFSSRSGGDEGPGPHGLTAANGHARIHHHLNQGTRSPTTVSFVWPSHRTASTVFLHVLNSELMCMVPGVDGISLKSCGLLLLILL
jgi:hypothetical protein